MSREEATAWAAGLFEGEGCVRWQKHVKASGKQYQYACLTLVSTDEDVVRQFHQVMGVGYVNGPYPGRGVRKDGTRYKPYWQWHAKAAKARAAIGVLLPLMCARRRAKMIEVLSTEGAVHNG